MDSNVAQERTNGTKSRNPKTRRGIHTGKLQELSITERLHITRADTHTSEDSEENRKEERNIKLELNTRNDKTFKVKQEKNLLLNKTSTVMF